MMTWKATTANKDFCRRGKVVPGVKGALWNTGPPSLYTCEIQSPTFTSDSNLNSPLDPTSVN